MNKLLSLSLEKREKEAFSHFTKKIQDMLFNGRSNRALKSVLIHGVSQNNMKKNAEAVSQINNITYFLSWNMEIDLAQIGYLLNDNFSAEERKMIKNQKKEYRIFVMKVMKNLKKVRYSLDVQLGSKR